MQLKRWDYSSYLHCIDAYIIGTLFARKLYLDNIEQISIGYLLHDIGKLNIPKEILQKPGRLNTKEFELMKSHTIEGEKIFKQIGLNDYDFHYLLIFNRSTCILLIQRAIPFLINEIALNLFQFKFITESTHRLDIYRLCWIGFNFFSQHTNMYCNRFNIHNLIIAPNMINNLLGA